MSLAGGGAMVDTPAGEVLGFGRVGWLDLPTLRADYADGRRTPSGVVAAIHDVIERRGADGVWTNLVAREAALARAGKLEAVTEASRGPLWGVPFSVKDCVDIVGIPTTSACPDYAYDPERTNASIQKLLEAGAILVGKANMDQFATGLVGIRSPYGIARNPFDPAYIPGGSSSGSAVGVAAGLVSFSIGTDTGGSGRIPAHYTNTVGLKPSRGLLSTKNYVPACRSIDCLTVYALTADDALEILELGLHYDSDNPYSRVMPADAPNAPRTATLRCAVPRPDQLQFFEAPELELLFRDTVAAARSLGWAVEEVDLSPYFEAGRLLFSGTWVAERYGALREFAERSPQSMDPIVGRIVLPARDLPAWRVFEDMASLALLQRRMAAVFEAFDVALIPTCGTCWRIEDVRADPIGANNANGTYTYGANLLDLSGCAVPAGFQSNGMPAGVTVLGPAFADRLVASAGGALHRARVARLGAASDGDMARR